MDDKKINLLPEDLRSKDDKSKRPLLHFNPDFKLPGKKEKAIDHNLSGGQISWWSKMFSKDKKIKTPAPKASGAPLGSSISYNDSVSATPKAASVEMRMPETLASKVEEHIQDFVPAQAKIVKPKGPSFWSKLFAKRKSKVIIKPTNGSALSNGLKYNGSSNGSASDLHQPEFKPNIKVFQELNKQAEETYDFNLKAKKISDQVSGVAKVEQPVPPKAVSVAPLPITMTTPIQDKIVKPKGPSLWARFLALFRFKAKVKKVNGSALSNGLKYNGNGNGVHQVEVKPEVKVYQELNKPAQESADINMLSKNNSIPVNEPVVPASNFDLSKEIKEEIDLAPLQPITPVATLEPVKLEEKPLNNGFSMPEYAPKVKTESQSMPALNEVSVDATTPKVTGPQFHIPEASQKNSLLNGRVDLIPIAARVRSWKQIGSLLGFAIILSMFILVGIYGYLLYDGRRIITKQNEKKQEIAKIEESILDFTELNKDINTLGQEIKLVQDALNKHIYWTNFFSLLEKYTVQDVFYSGLAVGTNGGLTLNASTKSYDSVAKQLKVLNSAEAKEFVKEASIMSAKQDKEGAVSFQIVLTLNQALFYYRQTE